MVDISNFDVSNYPGMVEWRKQHYNKEIVLKACKVFNRNGYQNATMNDVAKELGISKPTLYYYIKSKGDIVSMIVDYATTVEGTQSDAIHKSLTNMSPWEAITILIRERLKIVDELQDIYIFRHQLTSVLPKNERVKLYNKFSSSFDRIVTIVQKGITTGDFQVDDARFAGLVISYMITSWALRRWYLRRYYTLDAYTEYLTGVAYKILNNVSDTTVPKPPLDSFDPNIGSGI